MKKEQDKYTNNWNCHQDDIADLSTGSVDGRGIAVTGEVGCKATIHVWDTNTMKSLNQFSLGPDAKGVASVALSPCCRYVAVVDQSNNHGMSIFHTNKKKAIV